MDRERLTRLLEEPGKVAREDLKDLQALTERYPWFSGAHLLRAVGEQASGDILADETLRRSAAHVPARSVLFDLKDVTLSQAAALLKLKDPIQSGQGTAYPDIATIGPGEKATTPTSDPPLAGPPEPVEADIIDHPVEAAATPGPLATEPAPVVEPEQADELEQQILEAAIASAYDLTLMSGGIGAGPEVTPSLPVTGPDPGTTENEAQIPEVSAIETPAPEVSAMEVPASEKKPALKVARNARLRFTDWLTAEVVPEDAPAPVTTVPDGSTATEVSAPGVTEPPAAVAKEQKPAPKLPPSELIDRFIRSETPPPVRKAEFFTPQQAAKRSLDDSTGMVSETLARVYEKQGDLPRAIAAYRKLALKYPEKSAYFAGLSKSLEEKLNS